jgi:hypothetical protein
MPYLASRLTCTSAQRAVSSFPVPRDPGGRAKRAGQGRTASHETNRVSCGLLESEANTWSDSCVGLVTLSRLGNILQDRMLLIQIGVDNLDFALAIL